MFISSIYMQLYAIDDYIFLKKRFNLKKRLFAIFAFVCNIWLQQHFSFFVELLFTIILKKKKNKDFLAKFSQYEGGGGNHKVCNDAWFFFLVQTVSKLRCRGGTHKTKKTSYLRIYDFSTVWSIFLYRFITTVFLNMYH